MLVFRNFAHFFLVRSATQQFFVLKSTIFLCNIFSNDNTCENKISMKINCFLQNEEIQNHRKILINKFSKINRFWAISDLLRPYTDIESAPIILKCFFQTIIIRHFNFFLFYDDQEKIWQNTENTITYWREIIFNKQIELTT